MANITVIGAGAFGTSLALNVHKNGHKSKVWCFEKDLPELVKETGQNQTYLPGISVPQDIPFINDPEEAVSGADLILVVAPSAHLRRTIQLFSSFVNKDQYILTATKGIEHGSNSLMSTVMEEELPHLAEKMAFLSGPSFAKDVAVGHVTDLSCASHNIETARAIQALIHSNSFRIYTNDDVIGVELGGSLKNVMAIACGASDELGLGLSARAALMTRGLAEMSRLGSAMGAKPITFQGLSGVGDLILTCTGDLSRNRTLGKEIAHGRKASEIVNSQKAVAEGYVAAKPAVELAEKYSVDMPISRTVYDVCYKDRDLQDAIKALMSRSQKDEFTGLKH